MSSKTVGNEPISEFIHNEKMRIRIGEPVGVNRAILMRFLKSFKSSCKKIRVNIPQYQTISSTSINIWHCKDYTVYWFDHE